MIPLRPYQVDAVQSVRQHLIDGMKRVLVVSPTGSGKTVVFANIIASAIARGKRVLVVVHLQELVDQTINKLSDAGIKDVNVMRGNDKRRSSTAFVTVASIQTIKNCPSEAKPLADLVILDEAHRSLAASHITHVWGHYRCPILGFTATPCRTDGRGLGERYEAMVIAATYSQLIELDFVAKPLVIGAKEKPDMSRVRQTAGDWNEGEMQEVMKRLSGHIVPTWLAKAEGRSTIVFASGLDHSLDIVERFRAAGVTAEHLSGKTPENERKAILGRLRSGETTVVSNCAVLTEGFDCPSVRCVVIARPTMSVILHYQTSGRALRPGAIRPVIIDHAGNVERHGMPHHDRVWSLDGVAVRNVEANPFKQCKSCHAFIPLGPGPCPECGYEVPALPAVLPVEVEANMVDLEADLEEEAPISGPVDVAKVMAFVDMVESARSKGYRPGWLKYEWQKRMKEPLDESWLVNAQREYGRDVEWQRAVIEQAKRRELWQPKQVDS